MTFKYFPLLLLLFLRDERDKGDDYLELIYELLLKSPSAVLSKFCILQMNLCDRNFEDYIFTNLVTYNLKPKGLFIVIDITVSLSI